VFTVERCGCAHVETTRCGILWIVEPKSDMIGVDRWEDHTAIWIFVTIEAENLIQKDRAQGRADICGSIFVSIEIALIPCQPERSRKVGVFIPSAKKGLRCTVNRSNCKFGLSPVR
jgi:hypothetical protein